MKTHEFERVVRDSGGVLYKKDGDHHVWRLPNGRLLIVPVGGKHTEVKSYLTSKLKRLLRATS